MYCFVNSYNFRSYNGTNSSGKLTVAKYVCLFSVVWVLYHLGTTIISQCKITITSYPNSLKKADMRRVDQEKVILIASTFFGQEFSNTSLGRLRPDCPYKCRVLPAESITSQNAVESAHAVVFHIFAPDLVPALRVLAPLRRQAKANRSYAISCVRSWFRRFLNSLLFWREEDENSHYSSNNDQIWVLLFLESIDTIERIHATHPPVPPKMLNGLFNWTMSYRRDSEIFVPYIQFDKFEPFNARESLEHYANALPVASVWKSTKRHLAAIISNCEDSYGRLSLLKELSSYGLSVDIYGKCSPNGLTCPTANSPDCYKFLQDRYLFYASFENSICADYVSEKFFNILNYDMVPVVVSGANMSAIAPRNSYVDAKNFGSARELATFLLQLAENETLYNSYLDWKRRFRVRTNVVHFPICALCKKLHEGDADRKSNTVIDDMQSLLVSNSKCRKTVFSGLKL